jgi:hypothetical protein
MGPVWGFTDDGYLGLDTLTWVLWAVLLVVVVVLLVAIARTRWLGLRPHLFRKTAAVTALEMPGLLARHLDSTLWARIFQTTLARAGQALARQEGAVAQEAAAALDRLGPVEGALAATSHEMAVRVVKTGTLQSFLARVQEQFVYVLVFPARHEHSGLFRRHVGFADGWVEHVAQLRRQGADEEQSGALLCLLYFLGPQAADGTLLVAYDGSAGQLVPADLVPAAGGADGALLRFAERFDFQLA